MAAKDGLGRYGERVAERYLRASGLDIVERNWFGHGHTRGEIDLVARDGPTLVFCEVKTRSGTAYGDPAEAVTQAKAERLRELAWLWITERGERDRPMRFDVVTVLRQRRGAAAVRHLRGAF